MSLVEKVEKINNNPSMGLVINLLGEMAKMLDEIEIDRKVAKCLDVKPVKIKKQ
jgi:hypothetical protein